MAYIDREKFVERIKVSSAFVKFHSEFEGGILRNVVLDLLGNMPTADVVEVKHGEWLLDGRCSECLANPLTTHKNYCPNCGAKMDGK